MGWLQLLTLLDRYAGMAPRYDRGLGYTANYGATYGGT